MRPLHLRPNLSHHWRRGPKSGFHLACHKSYAESGTGGSSLPHGGGYFCQSRPAGCARRRLRSSARFRRSIPGHSSAPDGSSGPHIHNFSVMGVAHRVFPCTYMSGFPSQYLFWDYPALVLPAFAPTRTSYKGRRVHLSVGVTLEAQLQGWRKIRHPSFSTIADKTTKTGRSISNRSSSSACV